VEAKEATVAAPSSRLLKETAMEIAGVYDQFKQQRRVQATVASTYERALRGHTSWDGKAGPATTGRTASGSESMRSTNPSPKARR